MARFASPVLAALLLAASGFGQPPMDRRTLHTVEEIRSLPQEEAHAGRPVHLRGIVTLMPGWRQSFFFSDGRSGIYVDRNFANTALKAGDTVEVDGTTTDGQFAPSVQARAVRYTGHRRLPRPVSVRPADMRSGQQDSQSIALQGTVRSAGIINQAGTAQILLSIDMGEGVLVSARVLHFDPDTVKRLDGAVIRIAGVCGSVFNARRQYLSSRLFVDSLADVVVLQKPPADAFATPPVPLSSLLQFDRKPSAESRVHVQGTVTAVNPGAGFYLQQGSQDVYVETEGDGPVSVGMPVQAIGYVRAGTYSPTLVGARFRPAPPQPAIVAPLLPAAALLQPLDGYIYAPYDSLLVQLRGKLLKIVRSADEELLLLQSDGVLITAKLPLSQQQHAPKLREGSIAVLTGISSTLINEAHEAHGTTLLLRSAADIRILQTPPWWTGVHTWWVILALSITMLALLCWISFMRRQARLHDLVLRDSLTALYNRRGFLLMAERQWNQAVRTNRQMLLLYIDLDRFKELNDTHGHKQGDLALQSAASTLRDCFHRSGVIGRLGGDEFAVAVWDTPDLAEDAMRQRLRQCLNAANARLGLDFDLGLSMGVLRCGQALSSLLIDDLLSRADSLMYEQKRERRTHARPPAGRGDPLASPSLLAASI